MLFAVASMIATVFFCLSNYCCVPSLAKDASKSHIYRIMVLGTGPNQTSYVTLENPLRQKDVSFNRKFDENDEENSNKIKRVLRKTEVGFL